MGEYGYFLELHLFAKYTEIFSPWRPGGGGGDGVTHVYLVTWRCKGLLGSNLLVFSLFFGGGGEGWGRRFGRDFKG